MAPAVSVAQANNKAKRPMSIQTNGINSSTSSPSPSMSAGRLPPGHKNPQNSATANGGGNSSGARSANRNRPGHTLGRGTKNNSAGMRSGSIAGEFVISQVAQSQPYGRKFVRCSIVAYTKVLKLKPSATYSKNTARILLPSLYIYTRRISDLINKPVAFLILLQ